jgi:hypothetical protein
MPNFGRIRRYLQSSYFGINECAFLVSCQCLASIDPCWRRSGVDWFRDMETLLPDVVSELKGTEKRVAVSNLFLVTE